MPSREGSVQLISGVGIVGKNVGDVVRTTHDSFYPQDWTIEEISSVEAHALHEVVAHFSETFPNEPFLAKSFRIGDMTGVADWVPIIATIEARRQRTEYVLSIFKEHRFPVSWVAQQLGESVSDAMNRVKSDAKLRHMIEWPDSPGYEKSIADATVSTELVLDRTALIDVVRLGLGDLVAQNFSLVAPASLMREVRTELAEAEQSLSDGRSLMTNSERGLELLKLAPGHPALSHQAEELRKQSVWLQEKVRLKPRPAAGLDGDDRLRDHIGNSSADSIELVRHRGGLLFADDLGLRRFFDRHGPERSTSTVGILGALLKKDAIDNQAWIQHLLQLIDCGYLFVAPSLPLLLAALRTYGMSDRIRLENVFRTLSRPEQRLGPAIDLATNVIRSVAVADVLTIDVSTLVTIVMQQLSRGWPIRLVARCLSEAVTTSLYLWPRVVDEVDQAISVAVAKIEKDVERLQILRTDKY